MKSWWGCALPLSAGLLWSLVIALYTAPSHAIPPNSRAVSGGVGWQCNTGYRRSGGTCRRTVVTPATATRQNVPQACLPGYQRVGGQCRKVQVPANAYKSGVDWACDAGYFRSGGRCQRLDTPITVTAPPLVDRCDGGYVVIDGVCKMDVPERPRLGD